MTRLHRHPVAALLSGRRLTTLAAARIVHDLAPPDTARGLGLMSACELADEVGAPAPSVMTLADRDLASRAIALASEGRTTAQVAAALNVTYATAIRLINEGSIPRVGRKLPAGLILLRLSENGVRNATIAASFRCSPASVSAALKRARKRAALDAPPGVAR